MRAFRTKKSFWRGLVYVFCVASLGSTWAFIYFRYVQLPGSHAGFQSAFNSEGVVAYSGASVLWTTGGAKYPSDSDIRARDAAMGLGKKTSSKSEMAAEEAARGEPAVIAKAPGVIAKATLFFEKAEKASEVKRILADSDDLDAEEGGEEPEIVMPGRGSILSEPDRMAMRKEIKEQEAYQRNSEGSGPSSTQWRRR